MMVSLRGWVSRHRSLSAIGIVLVLVGLGVTVFWFEPQQLFIDDEVNEALPGAADRSPEDQTGSDKEADPDERKDPSIEPETLTRATFTALNHDAMGEALVLDVDGDRYLRFEEFEVENGPDLRVYLSSEPADGDPSALDEDFVDLGGLKGNVGPQNYRIPKDVDLGRYPSAVVWCRRFSVGFAVADIGT